MKKWLGIAAVALGLLCVFFFTRKTDSTNSVTSAPVDTAPSAPGAPGATAKAGDAGDEREPAADPMVEKEVKGFNFDLNFEGWAVSGPSLLMRADKSDKHGGLAAFGIAGSTPENQMLWAYSPEFPIEGGKTYRLTAWMKVDSISDSAGMPYVALEVFKGKWAPGTNVLWGPSTNVPGKGKWEKLTLSISPKNESNLYARLIIRKADDKTPATADFKIDDIKFEQMK
jgi:hypothetical protein